MKVRVKFKLLITLKVITRSLTALKISACTTNLHVPSITI